MVLAFGKFGLPIFLKHVIVILFLLLNTGNGDGYLYDEWCEGTPLPCSYQKSTISCSKRGCETSSDNYTGYFSFFYGDPWPCTWYLNWMDCGDAGCQWWANDDAGNLGSGDSGESDYDSENGDSDSGVNAVAKAVIVAPVLCLGLVLLQII